MSPRSERPITPPLRTGSWDSEQYTLENLFRSIPPSISKRRIYAIQFNPIHSNHAPRMHPSMSRINHTKANPYKPKTPSHPSPLLIPTQRIIYRSYGRFLERRILGNWHASCGHGGPEAGDAELALPLLHGCGKDGSVLIPHRRRWGRAR